MISGFFIHRPRFAMVIALIIVALGALALSQIPVTQYPRITPPEVQVSASYPGASADVVANSIAAPIEDQVNGVENMLYMSSTSTDNGGYSLTVTFAIGSDPAIDQVNVQNRVALATARLPAVVNQTGVSIRTRSSSILLGMSIFSPKGTRDDVFLSNFATLNVRDALTRVAGVGDANVFGPTYSMRIWMDPDRMQALGATAADISSAIQAQNAQASAGQIGSPPTTGGQQMQMTIVARGRLPDAKAFGAIILRTNPNGAVVRLSDVARVELGAQTYDTRSHLNGAPSATLVVYQAPAANALAVANAVRAELERLKPQFPEDVDYRVVFDTTEFVAETIREIVLTLGITVLLVVLVTYLFLQDWRSTLIPTLTIPVSLVGSFAILYALGYSANTITLFALILAIGLVVDDAIIVVENVQRVIEEEPALSIEDATRKAMEQITGPVIASTLVLAAVFTPVALLPGITGQLYRQFAVTITAAILLSGVNALTLSPALCRILLRREHGKPARVFRLFNTALDRAREGYVGGVARIARRATLAILFVALVTGGVYALFRTMPTGFIPPEDQGYLFVNIQLPNAASLDRTEEALGQVTTILRQTPGIANVIGISGSSMVGGAGSNAGMAIVALAPWSERRDPALGVNAIMAKLRGAFAALPAGNIAVFNPPAIPGLGATGGFDLRLQATNGQSPQELSEAMRALIVAANRTPGLTGVFSTYTADVPQAFLNINRAQAQLLGVPPSAIFSAMQAHLGSSYVDDFNMLGRVFQVRIQDEPGFRNDIGDINRLHVRSTNGQLVPLQSIASISTVFGPNGISRYNLFPAVSLNGQAAAGTSTGEALATMENVARSTLPSGYDFQWTGLALQERQAGGQLLVIFAMAFGFAYLFLVAQYESWTVPISVMLSVSLAVLGALVALVITKIEINVFVQIGLVLLVGLAAKNAILIVEFANHRRTEGEEIVTAALDATRLRFRPVLMTALAFILGVVPLVVATGAGAGSRRSIGTTVLGGMLVATILGLIVIPTLYVAIQRGREAATARFRKSDDRR
jgi:hydrophobe/amphiphile efflux-1 (HAE1) family protein